MKALQRVRTGTGFTLVELTVIIVVIGILAGIVIVGYGAWRQRIVQDTLKSDLAGLTTGMESARNFDTGYPVFAPGTEFNGTNATKSIFAQSNGVEIIYVGGDKSFYCVQANSIAYPSIVFSVNTEDGRHINSGACVGENLFVPGVPGEPIAWRDVSGGGAYWIALSGDGTVYSWGTNSSSSGYLGYGNTSSSSSPRKVAVSGTPMEGKTIKKIAAGYLHALALSTDNKIYAWGNNTTGALGDGTTSTSFVPVEVVTTGTPLEGKQIATIAASQDLGTSYATDVDGNVYSWGTNDRGQLGNGTLANSLSPVAVITSGTPMEGKKIKMISAGAKSTLAISEDNQLFGWGWNGYGQLGNGLSTTSNSLPVAVSLTGTPLQDVNPAGVSVGTFHSIAYDTTGKVYSWGGNNQGQLGINTNTGPTQSGSIYRSLSALEVITAGTSMQDKKIIQVVSTYRHSLALADDGSVYGWGSGNFMTQSFIPVQLDLSSLGSKKAKTISAMFQSRYALLTTDGSIYTWGSGGGTGSPTSTATPTAISEVTY